MTRVDYLTVGVTFGSRLLLVMLFLPFSALDKLLNFRAAVAQAALAAPAFARMLIVLGLAIEVCMSAAVLTGIADRLGAFVLAGYCVATALLWKQFWKLVDFRLAGPSQGRDVFWDFLKNLAVAGGFLMITFGVGARDVAGFFEHPLSSTYPYRVTH